MLQTLSSPNPKPDTHIGSFIQLTLLTTVGGRKAMIIDLYVVSMNLQHIRVILRLIYSFQGFI